MSEDLELAGAAAGELASALTGTSPGREGLEWVADLIRGRRARTQIKILARTAKAIEEAGLTATIVPSKILVPLLEYSSLESDDDSDMVELWANMLANAGTESPAAVLPSFPQILRQLDPVEARALDSLVDDTGNGREQFRWSLAHHAGLRPEHLDDLQRLGLISFRDTMTLGDLPINAPVAPSREMVGPTALGIAFVSACRAPKSSFGEEQKPT